MPAHFNVFNNLSLNIHIHNLVFGVRLRNDHNFNGKRL